MNQKALYYPYIHIQDVNWLKATLLLFSQVRRIVPEYFRPNDRDDVQEFARETMGRAALLSPANLRTKRVEAAQHVLIERILADAQNPDFVASYGHAATRGALNHPAARGFQVHRDKMLWVLIEALQFTGLAWRPNSPEEYDFNSHYLELHPRVGEAVMSTLAVAAATGEGLDIVGDRRSGRLHECLIQKQADGIYDAWLHPRPLPAAPVEPGAEEVFEFLIGFTCDLSALTPGTLATLQADREPLRKLVTELRTVAARIPAMDAGPERETYFKDVTATVLKSWQADRSNMTAYWRRFFGEGLVDTSKGFVTKVAENLTRAGETAATGTATGAAGGAAAAAAGGGGVAAMASAAVAGAGAGLAVGVVFHGAKTYVGMRKAERDSPYRYLTHLEEAGVVFRGDLGVPPPRRSVWERLRPRRRRPIRPA
jgi:hypothetical protein